MELQVSIVQSSPSSQRIRVFEQPWEALHESTVHISWSSQDDEISYCVITRYSTVVAAGVAVVLLLLLLLLLQPKRKPKSPDLATHKLQPNQNDTNMLTSANNETRIISTLIGIVTWSSWKNATGAVTTSVCCAITKVITSDEGIYATNWRITSI